MEGGSKDEFDAESFCVRMDDAAGLSALNGGDGLTGGQKSS
jgi:hypothetical protein